MMDPVVAPFEPRCAQVARCARRRCRSSPRVTGDWLDAARGRRPELLGAAPARAGALRRRCARLLESAVRAFCSRSGRARRWPRWRSRACRRATAQLAAVASPGRCARRRSRRDAGRARPAVDAGRRGRAACRASPAQRRAPPVPADLSLRAPALLGRGPPATSAPQALTRSPGAVDGAFRISWLVPDAAASVPEFSMPPAPAADRRPRLVAQRKDMFEDVSGIDLADADEHTTSSSSASTR